MEWAGGKVKCTEITNGWVKERLAEEEDHLGSCVQYCVFSLHWGLE